MDSFDLPLSIQRSVDAAMKEEDDEKFVDPAVDLIRHVETLDKF